MTHFYTNTRPRGMLFFFADFRFPLALSHTHTQELKMQCLIFWSQRYTLALNRCARLACRQAKVRAAIYLDVSARQCDLRAALRCEKCHKSNERHDERRRFVIMYARPHRGPPREQKRAALAPCVWLFVFSQVYLWSRAADAAGMVAEMRNTAPNRVPKQRDARPPDPPAKGHSLVFNERWHNAQTVERANSLSSLQK